MSIDVDDRMVRQAPSTARLRLRFDPDRLRAEVVLLRDADWLPERPFGGADAAGGNPGSPVAAGWDALPLRSQGGDLRRTDPGGPGLAEFADTPVLAELPYLTHVLRSLPCELRSARLLALATGAAVAEHVDAHHGLEFGQVRLHLPIVTNPDALLFIEGEPYCWEPGQLWYGDFGRPHAIRNDGATERIHLVVDCLLNPALLDLFPVEFRDLVPAGTVLHNRPPQPLDTAEHGGYRCRFQIPSLVLRSSGVEHASGTGRDGMTEARIDRHGGQLALFLSSRPAFGLTHLGGGDFRFAGWTEERTVRVVRGTAGPTEVLLRLRSGTRARDLRCLAEPLPVEGPDAQP